MKNKLKDDASRHSLENLSRAHKKLLIRDQKFVEAFSLPSFLLLCLIVVTGFTGMVLLMNNRETSHYFLISEGVCYMYFTIVGMISMTYSASTIPFQQQEIKDFCRNEYESQTGGNEATLVIPNVIKDYKSLKTIYKRDFIYLTAWDIIRLDKGLAFRVFGMMLSYGFLIIQLK